LQKACLPKRRIAPGKPAGTKAVIIYVKFLLDNMLGKLKNNKARVREKPDFLEGGSMVYRVLLLLQFFSHIGHSG
jgi:hypothetical protein